MKRLVPIFALLALCASASAAYVRITLVFTNIPATGDTVVRNGTTVRWTNNPLNSTSWLQTNGISGSATNLLRHLGANVPSASTSQTNGTNIVFSGADVTLGITGTWGYLTTNSTATSTNLIEVVYPFHNLPYATNRTNQADALVTGIDTNASVAFRETARALTNHVNLSQVQTVGNKSITNSTVTGGTNSGVTITNAPRANVTNLWAQSIVGASNAQFGLTSGSSVLITNAEVGANAHASLKFGAADTNKNGVIEFASGGTLNWYVTAGTNQFVIYDGGDAPHIALYKNGSSAISGYSTTALGVQSNGNVSISTQSGGLTNLYSRQDGSIVLGTVKPMHTNAVALTVSTNDTAANTNLVEILGASDSSAFDGEGGLHIGAKTSVGANNLTVDGVGTFGSISNNILRGTNVVNADLSFTGRSAAILVNGNNTAIPLGTNVYVKLSGATTIANIGSFLASRDGDFKIVQFSGAITNTIANESGAETTDTTRRILTGTGGDVSSTNNPTVVQLIYDGSASRWRLISIR